MQRWDYSMQPFVHKNKSIVSYDEVMQPDFEAGKDLIYVLRKRPTTQDYPKINSMINDALDFTSSQGISTIRNLQLDESYILTMRQRDEVQDKGFNIIHCYDRDRWAILGNKASGFSFDISEIVILRYLLSCLTKCKLDDFHVASHHYNHALDNFYQQVRQLQMWGLIKEGDPSKMFEIEVYVDGIKINYHSNFQRLMPYRIEMNWEAVHHYINNPYDHK